MEQTNSNATHEGSNGQEIGNQEFQMYTFHQHALLEQAGEYRKVADEQRATNEKKGK